MVIDWNLPCFIAIIRQSDVFIIEITTKIRTTDEPTRRPSILNLTEVVSNSYAPAQ